MFTALHNGTIFTGGQILNKKAILVENGLIGDIVEEKDIPSNFQLIDLEGMNIAPSFIDLQIYGGNGRLFSNELSVASIESTYDYCISGGAAHFMITMATNSTEKMLAGIEVVRQYWEKGGPGLLGLHLEGPYLNPVKKGAHIEEFIKVPTLDEIDMLLEKGRGIVRMMTIAPEQCSEAVIQRLLDSGILVSAGHSNATYQQGISAFNQGITAATHLFNAMSAFQSREPGMVGAIYNHPKVVSSVVCDGVHVDFAAVAVSKKVMKERLYFITDAVTETLTGEYQHIFAGDRYNLPNGILSGSSLTMMQCVKNGVQQVGIELAEALRMANLYPARLSNNTKLGMIGIGYKASFVVFNQEWMVQKIISYDEVR